MMKSILFFLPLLVLLLVQDSTEAPGPRSDFELTAGFDLLDYVPFLPLAKAPRKESRAAKPEPAVAPVPVPAPVAAPTPYVKNTTTIGGYINGHKGDKNGAQNNNTIEVKQMPNRPE